jgi:hypothetical protein
MKRQKSENQPGFSLKTKSSICLCGFLWTILFFLFGFSSVFSAGIYLSLDKNKTLESELRLCSGEKIQIGTFRIEDLDDSNLNRTLQKLKSDSIREGSARTKSVICLRNLITNGKISKEDLEFSLERYFAWEKSIFSNYGKWLVGLPGLKKEKVNAFLQSRYDLMVYIQSKTRDSILESTPPSERELNEEFSQLYLSVQRAYFDFLYSFDSVDRNRYFAYKKGTEP